MHISQKELYPLIYAFKRLSWLVLGHQTPIHFYTDHRNLKHILKPKLTSKTQYLERLRRWGLQLQNVDLIVQHISEEDNFFADLLSRCAQREIISGGDTNRIIPFYQRFSLYRLRVDRPTFKHYPRDSNIASTRDVNRINNVNLTSSYLLQLQPTFATDVSISLLIVNYLLTDTSDLNQAPYPLLQLDKDSNKKGFEDFKKYQLFQFQQRIDSIKTENETKPRHQTDGYEDEGVWFNYKPAFLTTTSENTRIKQELLCLQRQREKIDFLTSSSSSEFDSGKRSLTFQQRTAIQKKRKEAKVRARRKTINSKISTLKQQLSRKLSNKKEREAKWVARTKRQEFREKAFLQKIQSTMEEIKDVESRLKQPEENLQKKDSPSETPIVETMTVQTDQDAETPTVGNTEVQGQLTGGSLRRMETEQGDALTTLTLPVLEPSTTPTVQ